MYDLNDFDQDTMSDCMLGMIEAAGHQMALANELTKIVVEKSTKEMSAETIFAIFKQAAAVITEASPLKGLMQNLPTK